MTSTFTQPANMPPARRGVVICGGLVAALFMSLCAACSDSLAGVGQRAPGKQLVRTEIEMMVSRSAEVDKIDVGRGVNFGSDANPVIRDRFSAQLSTRAAHFEEIGDIQGTILLKEVMAAGRPLEMTGSYEATLRGDGWRIAIKDVVFAPPLKGRPADFWEAGQYVVEGSAEEKQLIQRLEEERLAEEAAEAERLRVEADAQAAALALSAQQAEELAVLRAARLKTLAGTWVAEGPIMELEGGNLYAGAGAQNCTNSSAVKLKLDIPKAQSEIVEAEATFYMSDTPAESVTAKAAVSLSADGENVEVGIPRGVTLKCTNRHYGGRTSIGLVTNANGWRGSYSDTRLELVNLNLKSRYGTKDPGGSRVFLVKK